MYYYLKLLSPTEQIGVMFQVIFGMLLLATVLVFFASTREFTDPKQAERYQADIKGLWATLRTSWFMAAVFWISWMSNPLFTLVLFALVSLFSLREFLTLSPTRRGDHRSLVVAFFVLLPVQYWLIGAGYFDLFAVFIPVYGFLSLPVLSALANDPQRFLERNAKLQWGVMVCVYGMSHVPAILLLKFPGYEGRNAFLMLFLVLVVQTCMVAQHLASRWLRREPVVPAISQSFHWHSWWIGMLVASVLGAALAGITPWVPGTAFAFSFIACLAGTMGHFVMKAIKRDRGIPSWGSYGRASTGAGGLLDRMDGLCFAAPVFYHSIRWYFGI